MFVNEHYERVSQRLKSFTVMSPRHQDIIQPPVWFINPKFCAAKGKQISFCPKIVNLKGKITPCIPLVLFITCI